VDPLMAGEAVARAAQLTGDPGLHKALEQSLAYVLKRAPRAVDGTIFHAGETIWSDSFHTTRLSLPSPDTPAKPSSRSMATGAGCGIPGNNSWRTSG